MQPDSCAKRREGQIALSQDRINGRPPPLSNGSATTPVNRDPVSLAMVEPRQRVFGSGRIKLGGFADSSEILTKRQTELFWKAMIFWPFFFGIFFAANCGIINAYLVCSGIIMAICRNLDAISTVTGMVPSCAFPISAVVQPFGLAVGISVDASPAKASLGPMPRWAVEVACSPSADHRPGASQRSKLPNQPKLSRSRVLHGRLLRACQCGTRLTQFE